MKSRNIKKDWLKSIQSVKIRPILLSKEGESPRQHSRFMRLALAEARKASKENEVPVGAVLVKDGKVVARGHNRIVSTPDPTAHAEILVLRDGARRLKNERLNDTILYTTIEPCSMCAGALVLARVSKVVYGAADPKAGAGGSLLNILQHPSLNHRLNVLGGIRQNEAAGLIRRFFRRKRRRR